MVFILAILSGFTLLSWDVSREYFEYRTATHIAIKDYPEDSVKAPAVVVCFRVLFNLLKKDIKIGELFTGDEDYLNDKMNTWRIRKLWARIPSNQQKVFVTKKYIVGERYCFFISILNRFKMEEVAYSRYGGLKKFYTIYLSVDPAHSKYIKGYFTKRCVPKFAYFSLVKGESSLSNPRNREIGKEPCSKAFSYYNILLASTSLINVRLPPPYDTNCLDYRMERKPLLSSHDCYNQCLIRRTQRWNVIPEITLIDRRIYNQSNEFITFINILENERRLSKFLTNNTQEPKELVEVYRIFQTQWKEIKSSCRESCSRTDCRSEDIFPQIVLFEGNSHHNSDQGNESLSYFLISLLTSHQPTLEVFTLPKQQLIDYIVYMSSMLSFWLGFCPLSLASNIVGKLQEFLDKRKKPKTHENRTYHPGIIPRIETTRADRLNRFGTRGLGLPCIKKQ